MYKDLELKDVVLEFCEDEVVYCVIVIEYGVEEVFGYLLFLGVIKVVCWFVIKVFEKV